MKKFYSIAMLLMLVASVSFLTSCNKDDDKDLNGGGSAGETQTYTGTLCVYDRMNEDSEEPESLVADPINNQSVNMTRTASTFGLSIKDLVLVVGGNTFPPASLSISGIPYTVSSSDADMCEVEYTCNKRVDILGDYATVTKVKGSFLKSSNVMNLVILATGSEGLQNLPVYIAVDCPNMIE